MLNTHEILGMNARNRLYTSKNSIQARKVCHSKFLTKQLMQAKDIAVAKILAIFAEHEDINNFAWHKLTGGFVIKPSNGSGGKGILVFTKRLDNEHFLDTMGEKWSLDSLRLHCLDILEGKYSTHPGAQTTVILEERVEIHPQFLKLTYKGTPDIRVIVYNSIPVMAMLRLPTAASEGRANLHQGAVGVGIDLATGITTSAITADGQALKFLPNTKRKINGFLVPHWSTILRTAVDAANAADLTYGGVDIFIDKHKGPLVVELNTHPGLAIQLANRQGLRRRLERISDLQVLSSEHGIKIARALFRSDLADKFLPPTQRALVSFNPQGTLIVGKKRLPVNFLVDTGRFRSCISQALALELGLCHPDDLLWFQKTETGEKAPVIEVNFFLQGKRVKTAMLVSKQLDKAKNKIRLGRRDLNDFIVSSEV